MILGNIALTALKNVSVTKAETCYLFEKLKYVLIKKVA